MDRKRIEIHLGNAGLGHLLERPGRKTALQAKQNPETNFVGIDLRSVTSTEANWRQIKSDFIGGLNSFSDNSVTLIRSDFALGYYTANGTQAVSEFGILGADFLRAPFQRKKMKDEAIAYVIEVLNACHSKLFEDCDLIIRSGTAATSLIEEAVSESNFVNNLTHRQIPKSDEYSSYWEKYFRLGRNKIIESVLKKASCVK